MAVVAATGTVVVPTTYVGGSLIVAGYNLLDPSSPVQLWNDGSGLNFGSGTPDTATVARLLTDGEVVTGMRTANRTIVLPIVITGTRRSMAEAVATLAAAVSKQQWSIMWTPDVGEPMVVFDCFRGSAVRDSDLNAAGQQVTTVILTIPALPFTRDANQTVLIPPTTAAGTVVLDSFANTTGLTGTLTYTVDTTDYPDPSPPYINLSRSDTAAAATLAFDTTVTVAGGSGSVKQTTYGVGYSYNPGPYNGTYYSAYLDAYYWHWARALPATSDLSQSAQVVVVAQTDFKDPSVNGEYSHLDWAGQSDRVSAATGDWRVTLYSANGRSTWLKNQTIQSQSGTTNYPWAQVVIPTTGVPELTVGSFDMTAVTSYRIELWLRTDNDLPTSAHSVWLQSATALPANGGAKLTSAYGLVTFPAVEGSARTPVSLEVSATGSGAVNTLLLARTLNPAPGFSPLLGSDTATTPGTNITVSNTITGSGTAHSVATWTRHTLTFNPSSYAVLARVYVSGSTADTITFTGQATGDTASTVTATRSFIASDPTLPASGQYVWVAMGAVTLPPRQVDATNSAATITFTYTSTNSILFVDLVALVDLAGEALFLNLPSGTTKSQVFVDAPGPGNLNGTVVAGNLVDRSDATSVAQWILGQPVINFDPGQNTITAVLDNASAGATIQVAYYPRWPGERG